MEKGNEDRTRRTTRIPEMPALQPSEIRRLPTEVQDKMLERGELRLFTLDFLEETLDPGEIIPVPAATLDHWLDRQVAKRRREDLEAVQAVIRANAETTELLTRAQEVYVESLTAQAILRREREALEGVRRELEALGVEVESVGGQGEICESCATSSDDGDEDDESSSEGSGEEVESVSDPTMDRRDTVQEGIVGWQNGLDQYMSHGYGVNTADIMREREGGR